MAEQHKTIDRRTLLKVMGGAGASAAVFSACGSPFGGAATAAGPNDRDEEKAVMAALDTMVRATINKDVATLAEIYHEDLMYSHTSGLTQSKAEVLQSVSASKGKVHSMAFDERTIRIFGLVALVKINTDLRQTLESGEERQSDLHILWVLVKGPQGWQIAARHPSRLPPPQAGG